MKKTILCGMFALLAGCADLSQYTTVDSNASAKSKMRACMLSEANEKLQAGTWPERYLPKASAKHPTNSSTPA